MVLRTNRILVAYLGIDDDVWLFCTKKILKSLLEQGIYSVCHSTTNRKSLYTSQIKQTLYRICTVQLPITFTTFVRDMCNKRQYYIHTIPGTGYDFTLFTQLQDPAGY